MKYLIVCIGNRDGGDDAVGPYIADELIKLRLEDIEVLDTGIAPENYTGTIKQKKPKIVILVDAVDMNLSPGEIRFVPKEKIGLMHVSTHGIPLSVLMKYLSQYIKEIKLIGIQPKTMNGPMTYNVIKGADELIKKIVNKNFFLIDLLN